MEQIYERCRVCLEHRESTICIFSTISIKEMTPSYSDIIHLICNIEALNDNELPQKICVQCAQCAENAYDFKLLCEHSNMILQTELMSHTLNVISENSIELKSEDTDGEEEENQIYVMPHEATDSNVISENIIEFAHENAVDNSTLNNTSYSGNGSNDTHSLNVISDNSIDLKSEDIDDDEEESQIYVMSHEATDSNDIFENLIEFASENAEDNSTLNTSYSRNGSNDTPEKKTKYTDKCNYCDYVNSNKRKLGKHMYLSHNDKKHIKCTKCDMRFFKKKNLVDHIRRRHKQNSDDSIDNSSTIRSENNSNEDENCEDKFMQNNKVLSVSNKELNDTATENTEDSFLLSSSDIRNKNDGKNSSSKQVNKNNKCYFCDYVNSNSMKLGRHMSLNHNDKKSIKCTKCDMRFFKKKNMGEHMRRKHKQTSDKSTDDSSVIETKNVTEEDNGIFEEDQHYLEDLISEDNQTNTDKTADLNITVKKSNELPSENIENNANNIIRNNSDDKSNCSSKQVNKKFYTYNCYFCDYSNSNRMKLIRHMTLFHNDKKNIQCSLCNRNFFTMKSRSDHIRRQHKQNKKSKENSNKCTKSYKSSPDKNVTKEDNGIFEEDQNYSQDSISEYNQSNTDKTADLNVTVKKSNELPTENIENNANNIIRNNSDDKGNCSSKQVNKKFYTYKCYFCDYSNSNRMKLERHMTLFHNDKKNIQCSLCNRNFFTMKSRSDHIRRQHKQNKKSKEKSNKFTKSYKFSPDKNVTKEDNGILEEEDQNYSQDLISEYNQSNTDKTADINVTVKKSKELPTENIENNDNKIIRNNSDDKGNCSSKQVNKKFYTYKCYFCDYSNSNRMKLERHMTLFHNDKKNIQCSLCNRNFFTMKSRSDHIRRQHKQNKKSKKNSNKSTKSFKSSQDKNVTEEDNGIFEEEDQNYSQDLISEYNQSNTDKTVDLNVTVKKSNELPSENIENNANNIIRNNSDDKGNCSSKQINKKFYAYKCYFCDYSNSKRMKLEMHMTLFHNDKKNIQCSICNRKFFTMKRRSDHIRRQHEQNKKCKENSKKCTKSYKSSQDKNVTEEDNGIFEEEDQNYLQDMISEDNQTNTDKTAGLNVTVKKSNELPTGNIENNAMLNTNNNDKKGNCSSKQVTKKLYTYKCYFCDYANSNRMKLARHMTLFHNDKKNIQCTICNRNFFTKKSRSDHIRRQHKQSMRNSNKRPKSYESSQDKNGIFKCEFCDYNNTVRLKVTKHKELQHGDKKKLECKDCGKKIFTKKQLSDHVRRQHKNKRERIKRKFSNIRKYFLDKRKALISKCYFCDFTSTSSHKLGKHMSLSHDDEKKVECTKCNKRFFLKKHMLTHIKNQHKNSLHICEICGKVFKIKGNLNKHIEYIHDGPKKIYKCEKCDKHFKSSSDLYKHGVSHIEDRNFKCDECGSLFKTVINLNIHVDTIHKKLFPPIQCIICLKFYSKSTLKRHMEFVHKGIRKHNCEECGKSFPTKYSLKTHQTVHTGERSHICEICGKGFSQAHVLRTHLKVHS